MGEAAQDLIEGRCNPDGSWADWLIEGFDSEEDYRYHQRHEKKESNAKWSMRFLKEQGIQFRVLNYANYHCRVGEYDFFPSTGLYIHMKTKKKGRGVKNLYNLIKNTLGKSTQI